ncbi:MAG: energy-coupled thiamine transporter ThiT [Oscillospiraceae bacterium]|jgi:thiamine transporter|nr:energy-coupled thiamine transporter ThiT [Oscillospiraceae bacterium]
MKSPSEMSRAGVLAECALMIAMSVILSMLPGPKMPFGGSVSWFSTLPVTAVSLRHGIGRGVLTALAYSATQLLLGLENVAAVPAATAGAMILCALLDYAAAYTAIGVTGGIARGIGRGVLGVTAGIAITGFARLLCSVLSGVLVWGAYVPENMGVWEYSIVYNASWCVPDVLIAAVGAALLSQVRCLSLAPPAR